MKDSLGREPRWNADRCAPHAFEARPGPKARQNTTIASVGVSPPNLFRSFPFVIAGRRPGNPCGRYARAALPPALCLLNFGMDHRIKSGGDESESSVTVAFLSSGPKTRRENGLSLRAPQVPRSNP